MNTNVRCITWNDRCIAWCEECCEERPGTVAVIDNDWYLIECDVCKEASWTHEEDVDEVVE